MINWDEISKENAIEGALNDALSGLSSFDNESFSNEHVFYQDMNEELKYLDGNGNVVTRDEIYHRWESLKP